MKICKLQDFAEPTPLWLLREKVEPGYYFYLEYPAKHYYKVLFRVGDWIIGYEF
jgi:hypothetical protein